MRSNLNRALTGAIWFFMAAVIALAQAPASSPSSVIVPKLIHYSGLLNDAGGHPLSGLHGVTFLLYKDQQGGAPVWMETQNVTLDKAGRYDVTLGATRSTGVPTELFASGEARWLAVQVAGESEQARVLLVAVPYALKAADAETVGGLPASAFVLVRQCYWSTAEQSSGFRSPSQRRQAKSPRAQPTALQRSHSPHPSWVAHLSLLPLTFYLWAQGPSANEMEGGAIQRVKALPVSSLDRSLPKVTLEFFLKYEGGGSPIKWEVNQCTEHNGDTVVDRKRDTAMCVVAEINLKDGRAATVLVSVGTLKKGPVDVPAVYGVRVTYPFGATHRLLRLSDLPAELHRPLPEGPKDLPPPVSALLSLSSAISDSHA